MHNVILKLWIFSRHKLLQKSMKDSKDQETIQSSTTPDPGYHLGK